MAEHNNPAVPRGVPTAADRDVDVFTVLSHYRLVLLFVRYHCCYTPVESTVPILVAPEDESAIGFSIGAIVSTPPPRKG